MESSTEYTLHLLQMAKQQQVHHELPKTIRKHVLDKTFEGPRIAAILEALYAVTVLHILSVHLLAQLHMLQLGIKCLEAVILDRREVLGCLQQYKAQKHKDCIR